jgi:hypothetical protein
MPKVEQLISVRVTDKGRTVEKRRINVEIEAPADLFNVADLMVQVISPQ